MEHLEKNLDTSGQENVLPSQPAFKISLLLIAVALIATSLGDLEALTSNTHLGAKFYAKVILGTLYVWGTNTLIADKLKCIFKSPETGKSTGLFKINELAVVCMGVGCMVDSLQLSDENVFGIIVTFLLLIIIPIWIVTQIFVAIKLMKNEALMLGISIIATAITFAGEVAVLADMSSAKENNEIILICLLIDFIVSMWMYACYNSYFKKIKL